MEEFQIEATESMIPFSKEVWDVNNKLNVSIEHNILEVFKFHVGDEIVKSFLTLTHSEVTDAWKRNNSFI